MPSSNGKSASGASRRKSQASMGNVANDAVDRSEETVLTRRQKRKQRRQTLRNQAEIAPFLGMDFGDDEEETKDDIKDDTKDDAEKKVDEKKKEEPNTNVVGSSPLETILEVDEDLLDDKAAPNGLRLDAYNTPPSGGSRFPGQDKQWWRREVMGLSMRTSMISRFA